jgi:hypothetical protein
MRNRDWLADGDRRELAAERIHTAAADLIARRGLRFLVMSPTAALARPASTIGKVVPQRQQAGPHPIGYERLLTTGSPLAEWWTSRA